MGIKPNTTPARNQSSSYRRATLCAVLWAGTAACSRDCGCDGDVVTVSIVSPYCPSSLQIRARLSLHKQRATDACPPYEQQPERNVALATAPCGPSIRPHASSITQACHQRLTIPSHPSLATSQASPAGYDAMHVWHAALTAKNCKAAHALSGFSRRRMAWQPRMTQSLPK